MATKTARRRIVRRMFMPIRLFTAVRIVQRPCCVASPFDDKGARLRTRYRSVPRRRRASFHVTTNTKLQIPTATAPVRSSWPRIAPTQKKAIPPKTHHTNHGLSSIPFLVMRLEWTARNMKRNATTNATTVSSHPRREARLTLITYFHHLAANGRL